MNDSEARYSIALPDLEQFRRLWERLPKLAKERTTIDPKTSDTVFSNEPIYTECTGLAKLPL